SARAPDLEVMPARREVEIADVRHLLGRLNRQCAADVAAVDVDLRTPTEAAPEPDAEASLRGVEVRAGVPRPGRRDLPVGPDPPAFWKRPHPTDGQRNRRRALRGHEPRAGGGGADHA